MTEQKLKLSAATLNLLKECPRCFYLALKKNLRRPAGPMPSIATGLDSLVTRYFHYYRQKGEVPPMIREKVAGHLASEELFDLQKGIKAKWLIYEDKQFPFVLIGKLDDCIVEKDGYSPLDYKTRASFPREIHQSYQLQMDIYTFLLSGNKGRKFPVTGRAYLLYFFPVEATSVIEPENRGKILLPFQVELKTLETKPESIPSLLQEAAEILKGEQPPASSECEYCRWAAEWSKDTCPDDLPGEVEKQEEDHHDRETLF